MTSLPKGHYMFYFLKGLTQDMAFFHSDRKGCHAFALFL